MTRALALLRLALAAAAAYAATRGAVAPFNGRDLAGKRLAFTPWRFVRPGSFRRLNRAGQNFPMDQAKLFAVEFTG